MFKNSPPTCLMKTSIEISTGLAIDRGRVKLMGTQVFPVSMPESNYIPMCSKLIICKPWPNSHNKNNDSKSKFSSTTKVIFSDELFIRSSILSKRLDQSFSSTLTVLFEENSNIRCNL